MSQVDSWTSGVDCRQDAAGKLWLVCAAKRTYSFATGRMCIADVQLPLIGEPVVTEDGQGRMRSLVEDTDFAPPKVATDIVVSGVAHSPSPRTTELLVGVAVGKSSRALMARGRRYADISPSGVVQFSDPTPFEQLPLSWEVAYGGYDAYAHDELDPPQRRNGFRMEPTPRDEGIFAYPRNKIGCCYFIDVDRERAHGAALPQIEDPSDPLTPQRFFVPNPKAWLDSPVPGGVGWLPHTWYPRMMRLMGAFLEHDRPAKIIRETQLADGNDLLGNFATNTILPRGLSGAAPGMAIERLRGDEHVHLRGLVDGLPEARFLLPGERPTFAVQPPGSPKTFSPDAVLQTVRIDTVTRTLSMTWCGTVRLAGLMREEHIVDTTPQVHWRRLLG